MSIFDILGGDPAGGMGVFDRAGSFKPSRDEIMLSIASQLSRSAGPSTMPVPFDMGAVGRGMQGAMDMATKRNLLALKLGEYDGNKRRRDREEKEYTRKEAARDKLHRTVFGTPLGEAHEAGVQALPGGLQNARTPGLLDDGALDTGDRQKIAAGLFDIDHNAAVKMLTEKPQMHGPYNVGGKIVGLGADGKPITFYDGGDAPQTELAKLAADLKAGRITQRTHDARVTQLTGGNRSDPLMRVETEDGQVLFVPRSEAAGQRPYLPPRADPLVRTPGEGGQPVYTPRSQAAGQPAYVAPRGGGGPSLANDRTDTDTRSAREEVDRLIAESALSPGEVFTMTSPFDPATGLPNRAYKPGLSELLSRANRPLYGEDPSAFAAYRRQLYGGVAAPAGAQAGGDQSAAGGAPKPPVAPVPMTTGKDGKPTPDKLRLAKGARYETPQGVFEWDGKNFVEVIE